MEQLNILEDDVETLTRKRAANKAEKIAKHAGWGATDAGLGIARRYIETTTAIVTSKKLPKVIDGLDPYVIALVCLQVGMSSALAPRTSTKDAPITKTLYALGNACEREMHALLLRKKAAKEEPDAPVKGLRRRTIPKDQRKTILRREASRARVALKPWPSKVELQVGRRLLEICLETPVFVFSGSGHDAALSLTEEAVAFGAELQAELIARRPYFLPLKEPPSAWTGPTLVIAGYEHPLIRSRHKLSYLNKAFKSGQLASVLNAVNTAQAVAYKINQRILEMVQWAFDNDIHMDGFPRNSDFPMPDKLSPYEWGTLDDGKQHAHGKRRATTRKANRANEADKLGLHRDLQTAAYIGNAEFWTPLSLDHRGRVYAICSFNYQRPDHVRALFQFAQGKPIDSAQALYWLKVHLANTGDFGKISKKSFEDRVKWVDGHIDDIKRIAANPQLDAMLSTIESAESPLSWIKADKPFCFLAACFALSEYLEYPDTPCHLPLAFDGSCSGLQHLAAMSRDHDTAILVNLCAREAPHDVYGAIAHQVLMEVTTDVECGTQLPVSRRVLDAGITRALLKRNVMTYSYSSDPFGMVNQHMADTMRPLEFKVMEGSLAEHPYEVPEDIWVSDEDGKVKYSPGFTAARYLANNALRAIEKKIKRPAETMRFLQRLVRAAARENVELTWTTPLGMPVLLKYPKGVPKRVHLTLHYRGVTLKYAAGMRVDLPGINSRKAANAVAPSFVHSMDACHLQKVALMAAERGITNMAFIHDSFGCLPSDAQEFRTCIKEAFEWLYAGRDVPRDVFNETAARLDSDLSGIEPVSYGTYDVSDIRRAEYAFA